MPKTPKGTAFFVAGLAATVANATAVSQADNAVFTADNTFDADDLVLVRCSAEEIDGRVFPVTAASAPSVTLGNCDTRGLTITGTITLTLVATSIHIPGVFDPSVSGGEAKTVTFSPTEKMHDKTVFDGFSATTETLAIDMDQADSAGFDKLNELSRSRAEGVLIKKLPGGDYIASPANFAVNNNPVMTSGQVMAYKVSIFNTAPVTRYTLG